MGPIPEDLIVFLLFGAFVLVQILRNWRRSKRRVQGGPVATVPAEMQTPAEAKAESPVPVPLPWTPTLAEGPHQKPAAAARHAQASQRPQTRRFSRRTLMGDRRSLQDAIVVATILGPCRARRPRDME
jgi:hypothetical protein